MNLMKDFLAPCPECYGPRVRIRPVDGGLAYEIACLDCHAEVSACSALKANEKWFKKRKAISQKETAPPANSALTSQVGGNHYKNMAIQPVEFIHANNIPFIEGNIIKYITRWREKGGVADLEKVQHYTALLIELENNLHRPDVVCRDGFEAAKPDAEG